MLAEKAYWIMTLKIQDKQLLQLNLNATPVSTTIYTTCLVSFTQNARGSRNTLPLSSVLHDRTKLRQNCLSKYLTFIPLHFLHLRSERFFFFFFGLLFPVRLNWETVVKCPCKAFFFFYGVTQPKVGVVFAISLRKTLFTFLWCTAEDEIHLRLI